MSDAVAKRDNAGKPDLSLLPYSFEVAVARVMESGLRVYDRDNYRKGHFANGIVASIRRHLGKFNSGEDIDADSGQPHLAHIAANCLMAIEQIRLGTFKDDRWKGFAQAEVAPTKLPIPTGAVDGTVWQVVVRTQSGKLTVAVYPDKEMAHRMVETLHKKHWPAPSFVLEVEPVHAQSAQPA